MPGPSLRSAVDQYLAAQRAGGTPSSTMETYGRVLRKLARHYPRRSLYSLTTPDLADFLYGPDGILVGRSNGTGTVYRAALRGLWRYGELMGWCRAVTVPQPAIRPRRAPAVRPTRLGRDELLLMLDRADQPMRCMLAVAMNTALRISDVLKIRTEDIDLQRGEIAVWVEKTKTFGMWPITADLDAELREYMTGRAPGRLFPVSKRWAYKHLAATFMQCGIEVESGEAWHVIRRSVARIYFDDMSGDMSHDHALRRTAALLGHSSQRTTERYLGMAAEIRARDESLRGQNFIRRPSNVIPMDGRRAR